MGKLRPEEGALEDLFRQYPYGRVSLVERVHSGLSGATVMLVSVKATTPNTYQGLAYAKIDRREYLNIEKERHLQAYEGFKTQPFQPIPSVIGPFHPVNGWSMLLYQPAHNVIGLKSLGETVASPTTTGIARIINQTELLLQTLFATWHAPDELVASCQPQPVPDLLRNIVNIGGKDRLREVENRLHTYDIPGRDHPLITFKPGLNLEFPNPFSYLLRPELWQAAPAVVCPRAPTHGDLHANNIICRMDPGMYEIIAPTPPWLIDLASFNPEGLPFFDLAYLELDLLLRSLPASGPDQSWQNWLTMTAHLASAVLPHDDMPGLETQAAWALVRPIRRHVARIMASVAETPGMNESLARSWWLAATAAGALITRRSRVESREQRVVTLLYAARSLAQLLDALHMPPIESVAAPILWREPPWEESPFPGLEPFRLKQASIFFGRNREIDEVLQMALERRFTAIVGGSGSGKSSLVWAGVLPRLEKGTENPKTRNWIVVRFTPGGAGNSDPFAALVPILRDKLPALADEDMLALRLAEQPNTFEELVSRALDDFSPQAELVLFIDQFEEIFSLVLRPELRTAFVQFLTHITGSSRLRAIVTMRADFYANCFDVPGLVDLLQRHYMLRPPDQLSLAEIITRPAGRANLVFEKGLVEQILQDTGVESGALALLAYTLEQLYRHRDGHRLTFAAYNSLGGVKGAIITRAEQVFKRQSENTRAALPYVFQQLVAVDDETDTVTRQRALTNNFRSNPDAVKLLFEFTKARLLVTDQDRNGNAIIEVAHEALLHNWPTLERWITETKEDLKLLRKLRRDAEEWGRRDKTPDLLWRHGELVKAAKMVERLHPPLSPLEQFFIRPEHEWLLDNPNTSHFRRADLGDSLLVTGDTRPGTGIRPDGVPDIVWCNVPHEPIKIAKYPVTYRQYLAFIHAPDGYQNPVWWEGLTDLRESPGEQSFKFGNRPAENVSWYDAMAFCRWLSARLHPDIVGQYINLKAETQAFPTPTPTNDPDSDIPGWLKPFVEGESALDPLIQMAMPPKPAKQMSEILASYQTARSQQARPQPAQPPTQPPSRPAETPGDTLHYADFRSLSEAFRQRLGGQRPFDVRDTQMTTEAARALADAQIAEYLRAARAHSAALVRTMPIRLPTETEWQAAVGGSSPDHKYPWGPEWNPNLANTMESGLDRTTAVGMYPPGQSPCGAMDMGGNVWEWTLTDYSTGGNEDLVSNGRRVLRGGSWRRPGSDAATHVSFAYSPDARYDDVGFRVVLAIPSIESLGV